MHWEAKLRRSHAPLWSCLAGRLAVLVLVAGVAGCGTVSTVTGWFGPNAKPKAKPAELIDFKSALTLLRSWEVNIGVAGAYMFVPATDGQAVYAASRDGRVVKVDLATGKELWRIEVAQTLSAGVGVGEGLVLLGTPRGEVLAYRTQDGAPAWRAKVGSEILVPPAAAQGVVAARGNDGRISLLEATDGKLRWESLRTLPALTLREQGHLLVTDKAVYAGHAGGRMTALALNNGAPLWEGNLAVPRGTTELERIADVVGPLAMDDRRVCGAAYQGRVGCMDLARGGGLWAREVSALRGVDMDGRMVYVADVRGGVLAFDKQRGTHPWKQDKLRDRDLSSPTAVAEKYVAVGDYQGYVHLLNTDDGAFVARAPTDGSPIRAAMVPLASGLVVQTGNGNLIALRIQ